MIASHGGPGSAKRNLKGMWLCTCEGELDAGRS